MLLFTNSFVYSLLVCICSFSFFFCEFLQVMCCRIQPAFMSEVKVMAKVTPPNESSVAAETKLRFHPSTVYAGIAQETSVVRDRKAGWRGRVAVFDVDGKPIEGAPLQVSLMRLFKNKAEIEEEFVEVGHDLRAFRSCVCVHV
jgi:hypothetical protein